jgi:hypothetical protein
MSMKPVKFVLLACAALAALIVFAIPYLDVGEGYTLWKLKGEIKDFAHPYIILGAVALPLAFAGIALATNRLPRWMSIVSVISFGIALFIAWAVFSKTSTEFGEHGALGAKLMLLALVGGIGAGVAGIVKPERA